jgi:hypothetical protein
MMLMAVAYFGTLGLFVAFEDFVLRICRLF